MRNPCFERRMLLCLVFLFCFLGNLYVLHRRHAFVLNVCCSTAACLLFADLRVSFVSCMQTQKMKNNGLEAYSHVSGKPK